MQVSYGPPGHRGVTHLMAVGADDDPKPAAVESGLMISALAMGVASLLGARSIAKVCGYATVGFGVATYLRRKAPRLVEVTRP